MVFFALRRATQSQYKLPLHLRVEYIYHEQLVLSKPLASMDDPSHALQVSRVLQASEASPPLPSSSRR